MRKQTHRRQLGAAARLLLAKLLHHRLGRIHIANLFKLVVEKIERHA